MSFSIHMSAINHDSPLIRRIYFLDMIFLFEDIPSTCVMEKYNIMYYFF